MDRDYELQTHQAEDRHWWYRGRRTVLEGWRLYGLGAVLGGCVGGGTAISRMMVPGDDENT